MSVYKIKASEEDPFRNDHANLSCQQLNILKGLPADRKQFLRISKNDSSKKDFHLHWKKMINSNSANGPVTSEILKEHVEYFRICVSKRVKYSAKILGPTFPPGLIMGLSVLYELWSLVEVTMPFPLLANFYKNGDDSFENEKEMKKWKSFDEQIADIGRFGTLATKNDGKLQRLVKREKIWIKKVNEWRSQHFGHPDYSINHPEEQKFRHRREALKDRIQQLRMYRKTYEKVLDIYK